MNPSNNRSIRPMTSVIRIPLFAALVYIYFCAPISLEHQAFVQTAPAAAPHNALANRYDPLRDPIKDLAVASEEAKRSNKNILVVAGGEWCSWCRTLEHFFQEHPDLEALLDKNYVTMKVSMSQENPNRAFLSRFPYTHGYPHIFILDPSGKFIHSQSTEMLEDVRSYNAKRFQQFLERYAPKRGA